MMNGHGPILLYELNEVPWRVIDWYLSQRPDAELGRLLPHAVAMTTVTHDQGDLHPWSTWPTVHRGVYNTDHRINFLNQDKTPASKFPPLWEVLSLAGHRVGVFGSLQSYPIPRGIPFSFYVPDTFAPRADAYPARYEGFQRVNLRQTREDGAVAQPFRPDTSFLADLLPFKLSGVRLQTCALLARHLVRERLNPLLRKRRSILQAPVAFDVFRDALGRFRPEFATFFTNHVAGMLHRYWKYVFPEDFGVTLSGEQDFFRRDSVRFAMDVADGQIGALRRYIDAAGGQLVITTSMGQEAVRRSEYLGELRLDDAKAMALAVGFTKPFTWHLAMQPDFNFEFETPAEREEFEQKVLRLVDSNGQTIWRRSRAVNATLNVTLSKRADVLRRQAVWFRGEDGAARELPLAAVGLKILVRDQGTGYHQPRGSLVWYRRGMAPSADRAEVDSIRVAPTIAAAFGVRDWRVTQPPIEEILTRLKS